MTGRERILSAFRGGKPDTVPFCPNIYYWFYHHLAAGTLPVELREARHPFDALRILGADILARWDTQHTTKTVFTAGEYSEEYGGHTKMERPAVTAFNIYPPHKGTIRSRFATPHGTLSQTWIYTEEAGADFLAEYWWKDWSEYKAIRFMMEATEFEFDAAGFHRWVERVGDDGVMMVHVTQSPLKTFHWLAGCENASLFLVDHPDEMKELAKIHEEKALALVGKIVDHAEAEVFISLDNLDSAFYPPYFFRDYCESFYSRAAEIVHGRGKTFVVHACGHNKAVMPLVGRSGVDCLEGLTPPPMGDVPLGDARALAGRDDFVVNGGMDATRLEIAADAKTLIHEYTRTLFDSMGDKQRFLFASSCSTPAPTPWRNLLHFRDAAREYGRIG